MMCPKCGGELFVIWANLTGLPRDPMSWGRVRVKRNITVGCKDCTYSHTTDLDISGSERDGTRW